MLPLNPHAVLLFDIDGVIRDVGGSYRRAIVETVHHYSGWRPDPAEIDALKGEGCWNNDWEASAELLRRRSLALAQASSDGPASLATPEGCAEAPASAPLRLPPFKELVEVFGGFYFGGDPEGDPALWRGLIGQEPLLVEPCFFRELDAGGEASDHLCPLRQLGKFAGCVVEADEFRLVAELSRYPNHDRIHRLRTTRISQRRHRHFAHA
jgi:HAD superfamily phosphatase